MTKKEAFSIAKRYGISLLISIPILFVVDMFLLKNIRGIWIIVIDAFIILCVYVVWIVIAQAYRHHITKKRTELLHNKHKLEQQKIEEQKQQKLEQAVKTEEKPTKIIQKQKRNYTNNKSKKKRHKK